MYSDISDLRETDRKLVRAVIQKAEKCCQESLAMIGLYGSAATGDLHDKSDLDLLILINDERGYCLADGFILDDSGVGYDIYCTDWQRLEADARCEHAHLSKLLDSRILYVCDDSAPKRLVALQNQAKELLASDERKIKARTAFDRAKLSYADCFLTDSLSMIRTAAAGVIGYLFDAVMLWHGRYFRLGVKRTFEELNQLELPFDIERTVLDVIRSDNADGIRNSLKQLTLSVGQLMTSGNLRTFPTADNISGTYEEMFSNWRNKLYEAEKRGDIFSSFINMASLQFMLNDIASEVDTADIDVMSHFAFDDLSGNAEAFDAALKEYLYTYKKAGIVPRRFANVDEYIANYLG